MSRQERPPLSGFEESPGQVSIPSPEEFKGIPNAEGLIGPDITSTGTPPQDDINQSFHISDWSNIGYRFGREAVAGLPTVLYKTARNFSDQHLFFSPVAGKDEIKAAKKERPGFVIPNGARVDLLNTMKENYDANATRENILAHSKPTIGGAISGFVGSALGSLIGDPISAIFAVAAGVASKKIYEIPEFLGVERQGVKLALGRFIQGTTEGGAFGLGQASGDKLDAIARGDMQPVHAMSTIGDNMFLGGFLHPIGGALADLFKRNRAFVPENADDASGTAGLMAQNGKDPQPNISLRNGFNQASKQFKEKVSDFGLTKEIAIDALDKRSQELQDLPDTEQNQLEKRSIEVHKALLQNDEKAVPKDIMDSFIETNQNSRSDFANGLGQSNLDITGPETENSQDLLEAQYPKDIRDQLLKDVPLEDVDEQELNDIKKAPELKSQLSEALKSAFNCMVGG